VDPANCFLIGRIVMALQAHGHLKVLLFRRFSRSEHPAHARRVGRHRLLHEDVFAGAHGVLEMLRTKRRWPRDQDNVRAGVDCFAIRIEADEAPLGRYLDR
jgi:hypothetical protein